MDKLNKKLSDFVSEQIKNKFLSTGLISNSDCLEKIENYANFLKQPLKLEMFVPCDEYDNVLEMPVNYEIWLKLHNNDVSSEKGTIGFLIHEEYQQAKENVLFDGFKYIKELRNSGGNYTHILKKDNLEIYRQWGGFHISGKKEVKTVEDLIPYNLTLTKNAINNEL